MTERQKGAGKPKNDTRFKPGNPGRRKGSRHKATMAAEALLDGEAEKLSRKAVEMALEGDPVALRLCLDRVLPARRERPVNVSLPKLTSPGATVAALEKLVQAVAQGTVLPTEATALSALIDGYRKAVETADLEARLAKLEEEIQAK